MGKGDTPRPYDGNAWEQAPYWRELERRRKAAVESKKRGKRKEAK